MKNNTIIIVLLITLNILVLGVFGLWFYNEKIAKPLPSASPAAPSIPTPMITPTPTPTTMPPAVHKPTPSPQAKSDLEMIEEAFAEKFNKSNNDVDVTINKNTGTYASGLVRFAGEMGGGWWLAYNDGVRWIIVADGNGTVPCEAIDPYDFPVDMVPECWDEGTGTLIQRS